MSPDPFARFNQKLAPLSQRRREPVTCAWCGRRGEMPHNPFCLNPEQRRARGETCQYGGTPEKACRSGNCAVCE